MFAKRSHNQTHCLPISRIQFDRQARKFPTFGSFCAWCCCLGSHFPFRRSWQRSRCKAGWIFLDKMKNRCNIEKSMNNLENSRKLSKNLENSRISSNLEKSRNYLRFPQLHKLPALPVRTRHILEIPPPAVTVLHPTERRSRINLHQNGILFLGIEIRRVKHRIVVLVFVAIQLHLPVRLVSISVSFRDISS